MAADILNVGTAANDGTGDPLRDAMIKVNTAFKLLTGDERRMPISEYDYFRSDYQGGMNAAALAVGTLTGVAAEAMHPGIASFACSASANSGYRYLGGLTSNLIAGGEEAIFIFQPKNLTNVSGYFGYHDSQTNAEPTDGVYLRLTGTTLSGKCRSNTTESVTGTTYTVSVNTWYKMKLAVNAAATLVTFTLYSEAGAVLWTDTVATNIPTGAGRQCTPNILVVNSAAADAKDMLWIDYHNFYGTKTLVR